MSIMNAENSRKCLLEVAEILDDHAVPFFLIQGTALGAYRDKGFTPTERDIDFGVLIEDLAPQAPALVETFVRNQFQIETYHLPFQECRTIVAWKYGVHVDIVGFMPWKDKRFTYSPVHPSVTDPYAIVHQKELLENYEPVELFGRTFQVPSPIEAYLQTEYGKDWRIPADDCVSRLRVYGFLEQEGVPLC